MMSSFQKWVGEYRTANLAFFASKQASFHDKQLAHANAEVLLKAEMAMKSGARLNTGGSLEMLSRVLK